MSFVIAALHKTSNDIFLASDSQMTNEKTGEITHGHKKIEEINPSVGIAYAGEKSFCEQVIILLKGNYAKQKDVPFLQSDVANDIVKYANIMMVPWKIIHPTHEICAMFFVAGYNHCNMPELTTINVENSTVSPCNTGWHSEEYRFSAAIPKDIDYETGMEICRQFLSLYKDPCKDPVSTLAHLIDLMSKNSHFVDNIATLWQAHRRLP